MRVITWDLRSVKVLKSTPEATCCLELNKVDIILHFDNMYLQAKQLYTNI